jgi:hypothetical protein
MPALLLFYRMRRTVALFILVIGLFCSTSSFFYIFLALFFVTIFLGSDFEKKVKLIVFFSLAVLSFYLVFLLYPFLFDRLSFVLVTGGSFIPRVLEPFRYLFENFTAFGGDIDFLKIGNKSDFFVNSFVYIALSYGLFGTILLSPYICSLHLGNFFYFSSLILAIAIEGMTGRIDFWILLLLVNLIYNASFERARFEE